MSIEAKNIKDCLPSMTIEDIIAEILDEMQDHMNAQPYEITCGGCGKNLVVEDTSIDNELDLSLTIKPCSNCCIAK